MEKPKKERVAIYIDGSNFFKYLKDKEISFPKGVKFSYEKFIDFLLEDRELVSKRYYVGIARNFDNSKKSKKLVRGQQKFLSKIENDGFTIKRGRLMYDRGDVREKGTDVKIATDMIIGAVDDLYDTAILISSDTDLIPAIKYIKYKEKRMEYVGFSHSPSLGIQKHVNSSLLLDSKLINTFKVD
ncbi:MAG: NYN domain-containing protein [Candidatus Paceibacterota bacterium]